MEMRSDEIHLLLVQATILKVKDSSYPLQAVVELADNDKEIAFALLHKNPHDWLNTTGRGLQNEAAVLHHPTTSTVPIENDDDSKFLCCQ